MGRKIKDVLIDVEVLAACEEIAAKEEIEKRRSFSYVCRLGLYDYLRRQGYKIPKGLEV